MKGFELRQREHHVSYERARDVWCRSKSLLVLSVSSLVMFNYLTVVQKSRSGQKHFLPGRIAKVEISLLWLWLFLRTANCGPVKLLLYEWMICACDRHKALLHVRIKTISQWFVFGMFWELSDTNVDPVLVPVAKEPVVEVDWDAYEDWQWIFTFKGLVHL